MAYHASLVLKRLLSINALHAGFLEVGMVMGQRKGRGNRFDEGTIGFLIQTPSNPSPLLASYFYKGPKARYSLSQPPT